MSLESISVIGPLDPERVRLPLERELAKRLDDDPAFDRIRTTLVLPDAKVVRRQLLGRSLMLSEGMAPEAHAAARDAMATLGVQKPIEIFQSGGRENAALHLSDDPVLIEIQGRLLSLLDRGAMLAVMGHELGHYLAHGPGSSIGISLVLAAMLADRDGVEPHIRRIASAASMARELTADRFGLLACQDLDAALRLEMVATTGLSASTLTWDTSAYLAQSRALMEDALAEGETALGVTHPEHSLRAYAVFLWSESDLYRELTGKGPGTRPIAEVDATLARFLARADLDPSYAMHEEAPREVHECALACGVFVAGADGEIGEQESAALERMFAPRVPDWSWYLNFENAHQRFAEVGGLVACSGDDVKRSLFHLLVHVVGVDGSANDAEIDMIVAVGDALGCGTMFRALLRPSLRFLGAAERDLSRVTASLPLPPRPGESEGALRALLSGFVRRRGGSTTLRRLLRVLGEKHRSDRAVALVVTALEACGLEEEPAIEGADLDDELRLVLRGSRVPPEAKTESAEAIALRQRTPALDRTTRALSRLRDKLVSGDGRSPSVRLYGPRPGRVFDLSTLEDLSVGLSERVLAQLRAAETASLVVAQESGRHEGARRVTSELIELERENRARVEETGAQDLFLGYPFLTGVVGGYLFRAPIVLQPIELVRDDRGARSFTVRAREGEEPIVNQALLRLVFHKQGFAMPDELAQTLDRLAADPAEGPEAVLAEVKRLGIHAAKLTGALAPLADRSVELATWQGTRFEVEECAVLGLFPQSSSDLLQDYDALLTDLATAGADPADLLGCARELLPADLRDALAREEDAPSAELDRAIVPIVAADPSQHEVIRHARVKRALVVDGPPGTGKSQVIVNLVADALGRGERVAVVCEKRAALDVVAQRLDAAGLRNAFALVHDVHDDRRPLYKQIGLRLEAPAPPGQRPDDDLADRVRRVEVALEARASAIALRLEDAEMSAGQLHALIAAHDAVSLPEVPELERMPRAQLPKLLDQICAIRPYVDLVARERSAFRDAARPELRTSLDAASDSDLRAIEAALDAAIVTARALEPIDAGDPDVVENARAAIERAHASRTFRNDDEGRALFVRAADAVAADEDAIVRIEEAHAAYVEHRDALEQVGPRVKISLAPGAEAAVALMLAWSGRLLRFFVLAWWRARSSVRTHLAATWPDRVASPLDRGFLAEVRARIRADRSWRALDACADALGAKLATTPARVGPWIERLHVMRDALGPIARSKRALLSAGAWPSSADDPDALEAWEAAIDRKVEMFAARDAHERAVTPLRERFPWLPPRPSALVLGSLRQAWIRDGRRLVELDRRRASARATFVHADAAIDALVLALPDRDAAAWCSALVRVWAEAQLARAERAHPEIAELDRATAFGDEAAAAAELGRLSTERMAHERDRIVRRLDARDVLTAPTPLKRKRRTADQAAREAMLKECRKQRSVMPLRSFVRAFAPRGLLDVVPAWLLSPETMAVLFPREPLFDLVVFDEASQCTVESGVPVLLRARRVVIAGDEKQMPPTSFFTSALDGDREETTVATSDAETLDAESLLTLARSRVPHAGLAWHYRCREEELIAFSNHAMYGGDLLTVPSTSTASAAPAVRWVSVPDGDYDAGRNLPEARRVVEVIEEILRRPSKTGRPSSIGVITFNIQQRKAVLDEVDRRRAADADFATLWDAVALSERLDERPFVKNLENVQGDERDVIIFSLGHAPLQRRLKGDASRTERYVPSRFGPLGLAGGERRLNVAISRARAECIVCASFEPDMLSVASSKHDGPKLFKMFLEFSHALAHGRRAEAEQILDRVRDDVGAGPEARRASMPTVLGYVPIEAQIAAVLEERGYACALHVGTSKFRVSLAVADPREPSRYRVAVICDEGLEPQNAFEAHLHRPRVLAARGWNVVRVDARAWLRQPTLEIERIVRAIESETETAMTEASARRAAMT